MAVTASYIKYGDFSFKGASGYPVPALSISKEQQRDGGGRAIGATLTFVLEGQIYSSSGGSGFSNLLTLESGLRKNFSTNGLALSIGCGDSTSTLDESFSGVKITKYAANKTNNNWTTTIDYSIELQVDIAETGNGIFFVSSTQDDYTIETVDEYNFVQSPIKQLNDFFGNTNSSITNNGLTYDAGNSYPLYRITRALGAVGKFRPTGSGGVGISSIQNAKEWVNYHLEQNPKFTGVIATTGLTLYNFVRSISASDTEGSYKITDTWLGVPSGKLPSYIETFSAESTLDNSMLRTLVIQGTVKGLEPFNTGSIYDSKALPYLSGSLSGSLDNLKPPLTRNKIDGQNQNSKFVMAMSGYSGIKQNMLCRVNAFANTGSVSFFPQSCPPGNPHNIMFIAQGRPEGHENGMNPIPYSIQEGFNPSEGTITYNWTFNNRPLNLIPGSISESLSVEDSAAIPNIASIFVLGRKLGPILQDLGTVSAATRTVTFEVIFPRPTGLRNIASLPIAHSVAVDSAIDSFDPIKVASDPGNGGVKSYIKANNTTWNISEGRLTRIKTWDWVRCVVD
jgi:hypothetical protein